MVSWRRLETENEKRSMNLDAFHALADRQLSALFPWTDADRAAVASARAAIDARFIAICSRLRNKYYADESLVSPLHSCQYAICLYLTAHLAERPAAKDMAYNLLKIVSGADIYHAIELPESFFFDHPVGTVLGRATYGNHFMFAQGVTVGNNKGAYPVFGDCVCLNSGAKVLGDCRIGDNVIIAANAYVKDRDIPPDSLVFGQDRALVIKTGCAASNREFFRRIFSDIP